MTMLRRARFFLIAVALTVGLQPAVVAQAGPPPDRPSDSGSTDVARARVATEVLMDSYDPDKAWFPSSGPPTRSTATSPAGPSTTPAGGG